MTLLISDANIFIDFEDGGLLEALFRLASDRRLPWAEVERQLSRLEGCDQ